MNRGFAYGLLLAGVVLLLAGLQSSKSATSQLSEAFNNRPTQETTVLTVAGLAGIGAGVWLLLQKKPK